MNQNQASSGGISGSSALLLIFIVLIIGGWEYVFTVGVASIVGRYPVASFGPSLLKPLLNGRTVVEADATADPQRRPEERAAFAALGVQGHVAVPLVKDARFVAGLTVQAAGPRAWSSRDVALIEETAERTWAAVEKARTEAELRLSEERLAFVRRSSGVGFWYCDLPFDVLQWDDLVKEHFHLPPDARVSSGQRVVTSGSGGGLPAGLPIGTVIVGRDGVPRVQPLVAWNKLEFVRVVDFGLEGDEIPDPVRPAPAPPAAPALKPAEAAR